MENKPQTFIFFGRSGSGKGTQAKLLKELLEGKDRKVIYLETGEKFRNFIQKDNYTANLTKEVMKDGGLLPPFLPVWIWADSLIEQFSGVEDLILDGLARRASEAPVLDSAISFYKRERPYVISINVSRDWSKERMMSRGRSDDTEEYIESRLDWYDRDVLPAMEYFRNHSGYHFIDVHGEQSIEKVHEDLVKKISILKSDNN